MKTPPSPSVPYAPLPRRQGGGPRPGPPLNALSGETAGGRPDAERGRRDFERQDCQSLHQIDTRLLFQSCTQGCVFIKTAGVHGDPRGWGSCRGVGATGAEEQDRKGGHQGNLPFSSTKQAQITSQPEKGHPQGSMALISRVEVQTTCLAPTCPATWFWRSMHAPSFGLAGSTQGALQRWTGPQGQGHSRLLPSREAAGHQGEGWGSMH